MNKLALLVIFFSLTIISRSNAISPEKEEETFYWYFIKIGKTDDGENSSKRIFIKRVESEIKTGTFDQFIKDHLSGLKTGKIALGPFSEQDQAINSQNLYKSIGKDLRSDNEFEETFNFYYIKPVSDDFEGEIKFERIPARVTNGTKEEFLGLLEEGFSFEKLAIGPFKNYDLAEKSKYVFRKNGELEQGAGNDPAKSQALHAMAKKWKSLNLDIVKQADDKKTSKYTFRFSTKFPRKYFAPDAFQSVTVKALYSEPNNSPGNSFTLQGDNVIDNNPVISFEVGTVYINVFYFDMVKDAKVRGFQFDSFIYNDQELIQLEPIFLSLK
ncbi:MAG: hypothetical protein U0W24_20885 [Bacteroidales bacterium]